MTEALPPPVPRMPLQRRCQACGYRYESNLTECPLDGVTLGKDKPGIDMLGPFRLKERIGVGGMGAVYRAIHEKVGRSVAIKLLHKSAKETPSSVQRFFYEARAVNTIRHPNVVEVHDLQTEGEDLYMVLELLRGKDLRSVLDASPGRRLLPDRVAKILEQVCGALQAAHDRNIIHRDLKPENVFVTNKHGREDFVKLLDFGMAKLERAEGRLTREGATVGTPEYMAPEQARGQDVDHRADVYSVGCIAYELLTGRPPFWAEAAADVMIMQVTQAPTPPREYNPEISVALQTVILRCLSKDPQGRPQSALDLAQELAAAEGLPFDSTGAFINWRSWDGPSSVSLVGITPMPVMTPTTSQVLLARTPTRGAAGPVSKKTWTAAALVAVAVGIATGAVMKRDKAPVSSIAQSAGLPTPETQRVARVHFQSQPPGAQVVDGRGHVLGITPFEATMPLGAPATATFTLAGHLANTRSIDVTGNPATLAVVMNPEPHPTPPVTTRKATPRRTSRPAVHADSGARPNTTARTINPF